MRGLIAQAGAQANAPTSGRSVAGRIRLSATLKAATL